MDVLESEMQVKVEVFKDGESLIVYTFNGNLTEGDILSQAINDAVDDDNVPATREDADQGRLKARIISA